MNNALWKPSEAQIDATEIRALCMDLGLETSYEALHSWSVEQPEECLGLAKRISPQGADDPDRGSGE